MQKGSRYLQWPPLSAEWQCSCCEVRETEGRGQKEGKTEDEQTRSRARSPGAGKTRPEGSAPGLWSHRPIWCPGTGIMQDFPRAPPPEGAAPEKARTVLRRAVRAVGVRAWKGRLAELCRVWGVRQREHGGHWRSRQDLRATLGREWARQRHRAVHGTLHGGRWSKFLRDGQCSRGRRRY